MQKHRQDLKNLIIMQYGQGGWNELLAMEGKIRKDRAEFVHTRQEQRDKKVKTTRESYDGYRG